MSVQDLEIHLTEPIPLAKNIGEIAEKIRQDQEMLITTATLDEQTRGLYAGVKNPETHGALGVLAQYLSYKKLLEGVGKLRDRIGNFYRVKVNGTEIELNYDNSIRYFIHRLSKTKEGISALVKLYKNEIAGLTGSVAELLTLG